MEEEIKNHYSGVHNIREGLEKIEYPGIRISKEDIVIISRGINTKKAYGIDGISAKLF